MTLADWCRSCGHNEALHRQAEPPCSGQSRVGFGEWGYEFAPCRCDGFTHHTNHEETP